MYRWLLTVVCPLALGLTGCGGGDNASTETPLRADSALIPDSEMEGARIYLYDRGEVTAEIYADRLVKFEAIDSTMAYALDVDVFDSLGQVSAEMVGDSGVIREQTGNVHTFGHVVLVSENGSTLKTDYLFWNSKTDRIEIDTTHFVTITRDNDIMTSWGLEADLGLDQCIFLKDPQGTFVDPEKLMEP